MKRILVMALMISACSSPVETPQPSLDAGVDAAVEVDTADGTDMSNDVDAVTDPIHMAPTGPTSPSYGTLNVEQLQRMQETAMGPDDSPFHMVNLIRFRQLAEYSDGRETTLTGREANDLYNPIEILLEIGAQPVFVADVSVNLPLGDGQPWDQVAVVRYPSRLAFLQMTQREDFQERSIHKDAGVEKSIVLVTQMIDLMLPDDFEPADPAFPATDEDPAFDMVHLMSFHDVAVYEDNVDEPMRSGREAVDIYSQNASEVAGPLGVYPRAWFEVEGELIGDGRPWHELRINHFPSGETFRQLMSNPDWESGTYHRDAGLADTYSLMTAPLFVALD